MLLVRVMGDLAAFFKKRSNPTVWERSIDRSWSINQPHGIKAMRSPTTALLLGNGLALQTRRYWAGMHTFAIQLQPIGQSMSTRHSWSCVSSWSFFSWTCCRITLFLALSWLSYFWITPGLAIAGVPSLKKTTVAQTIRQKRMRRFIVSLPWFEGRSETNERIPFLLFFAHSNMKTFECINVMQWSTSIVKLKGEKRFQFLCTLLQRSSEG